MYGSQVITNKSNGQMLENELDLLHSSYLARGIAFVRHNGTKAEMRGGEWTPQLSLPDYEGLLTLRGGRHVAFDAKYRSRVYYYHARDSMHQCHYLYDIAEAGGIAFLLVVTNRDEGYALWPQSFWQIGNQAGWSLRLAGLTPDLGVPIPAWSDAEFAFIPDWSRVVDLFDARPKMQ